MKLYATTTSERASKGQGGKYLLIDIYNEKKQHLYCISVKDNTLRVSVPSMFKNDYKVIFSNTWETKGKSQKGEKVYCECGNKKKADELWCKDCDHNKNCTCPRCSSIS